MASKYFIAGGVDNKFGTAGNWASTDGGAHVAETVPTVADDIFFTSNSPNTCLVDSSNRAGLTLTTTGYTGTITLTTRLTISGAIILSGTTVFAGAEFLQGIVTASHTFAGATVPNLWFSGASQTHTLAETWTVTNLRIGSATNATVINSGQINISGNLDLSQSSTGVLTGSTNLNMTGTGSILLFSSTGTFRINLIFNTAGTITFGTGSFRYNSVTMTYTAGTVDATNCDLICILATTFDLQSAVKFKTVTMSGTGLTITLSSPMYCLGLATLGASTNTTTLNGSKLYIAGGITFAGTSGLVLGTTELVLNGTGTVNSLTTGLEQNPITIDAGIGTITVSGTGGSNLAVRIDFSKLKFTSGTVITDSGTWTAVGSGQTTATPFVG